MTEPPINEAYIQDTEARLRREIELLRRDNDQLLKELQTLREAYGRLMRGVEEKMRKSTFADCVPGPRKHREPELGPLGMGSAEGIKNQAGIYKVWKALHDGLRAEYPDLPDLTPIMKGELPVAAPDEWFVWAVDRLRDDHKDGNFHRSYRFAQELMTAIDEHGYAIAPKPKP